MVRALGPCLIAALVVHAAPRVAAACSCVQPPPPKTALEQSSAVFEGKVVKLEHTPALHRVTVTFAAAKFWKGTPRSQVRVTTVDAGSMCGLAFAVGEEWLVYASGEQEALSTGLCTRTRSKRDAAADHKALGAGAPAPQRATKGESSTSEDAEAGDAKADPLAGPDARVGDAKAGDAKAGDTKADPLAGADARAGDAKADPSAGTDTKVEALAGADAKGMPGTEPAAKVAEVKTRPAAPAKVEPAAPAKAEDTRAASGACRVAPGGEGALALLLVSGLGRRRRRR